ncbi:MAG: glycosyltransferase family 2 protein [Syntrophobacterales bacterium]|nr:glycosyltransferase family 2 protein [Syntrophobacterales bacterium]
MKPSPGHDKTGRPTVALIIPALNEASALPGVLSRVPAIVTRIIVADNGSTDETGDIARIHGAEVVFEPIPGYGGACLAGINALLNDPPDIVAFADADGSDGVENLDALLHPILAGEAHLSLAQRIPDSVRAMTFQQRFGNWLATRLIRLFWGHDYHDLGPMRAISWQALQEFDMTDRDFGWTVEMQIKALKARMNVVEIPLPYHARTAGESKVSHTLSGVVRAGTKILWVIGLELLRAGNKHSPRRKLS